MSCFCCETIYNLGCFRACDDTFLETGLFADLTNEGVFALHLNFNGIEVIVSQDVAAGDEIVFPLSSSCINESYTYTAQIYDKDGNIVPLIYGETTYDCIKFQTIIQVIC